MKMHFILYVADQPTSTAFYRNVLDSEPRLNVPGMTEFSLGSDAVLGLMPSASAAHLLGDNVVNDDAHSGARAEVYLIVDDPAAIHERAIHAGARELSPLKLRDWQHFAAYSIDPDGHVLGFAAETL